MIVVTRISVSNSEGQVISSKCGKGKINKPELATVVEADGRELEQITKNAPFLRGEPAFPDKDNEFAKWNNEEAIAAVLAFNHNEED